MLYLINDTERPEDIAASRKRPWSPPACQSFPNMYTISLLHLLPLQSARDEFCAVHSKEVHHSVAEPPVYFRANPPIASRQAEHTPSVVKEDVQNARDRDRWGATSPLR